MNYLSSPDILLRFAAPLGGFLAAMLLLLGCNVDAVWVLLPEDLPADLLDTSILTCNCNDWKSSAAGYSSCHVPNFTACMLSGAIKVHNMGGEC